MKTKIFIVGSFGESLLEFRGALIRELIKNNYEISLAIPFKTTPIESIRYLESIGVHLFNLKLERAKFTFFQDLHSMLQLILLFLRIQPKIAIFYTIKPIVLGTLAASICFVPNKIQMFTGLGHIFTSKRKSFSIRFARLLTRLSTRLSTKYIFQNKDDAKLLRDLNFFKDDSKIYISNGSGVDLNKYSYKKPTSKDTLNILMVSRIIEEKGIIEYIDAAKNITNSNLNIKFNLAGFFDENPTSIKEIEFNELTSFKNFNFLGKVANVTSILEETDIFVLPSYREGTPRSVLEAMAIGRPIITTNVPGCRETVIDGENGFLIDAKSSEQIIEKIQIYIDQPNLILKHGLQSRKIAESKYSDIAVAEGMVRFISK